MIWEAEMILRLLLALLFGGLIGFERESLNKAAGLRTHALVAVGSCLIMLVSITLTPHESVSVASVDSARIAAQVVSGVGFLGAGAIMRSGVNVRGLTTAATLWLVAGLGLAVGSGNYLAASFTTILVFILLVYFCKIEELASRRKRFYNIVVTLHDQPGQMGSIAATLKDLDIEVINIDFKEKRVNELVVIEFVVKLPYQLAIDKVKYLLENIAGVDNIKLN